ncbi:hypothetical protein DFS34DRAFT_683129 [Phlyctochytrium arcticum]|nr:hypothetical protein DFS34DRAFT_683129 [Phlyctochytrium arcticum]
MQRAPPTQQEALRLAAFVAQNYVNFRQRQSGRHSTSQPTRTISDEEQRGRGLINQITNNLALVRSYQDMDLQDAARAVIPVDRLHEEAQASVARKNGKAETEKDKSKSNTPTTFDEELVRALLRWFKGEFFKWTNQPPCSHCAHPTTTGIGSAAPTPTEARHGGHRVETYHCAQCHGVTRFPRYNDPIKLLETRHGRCGEWANVFTLMCVAMGMEARYVLDLTDHVWTEVWSESLGRWVNCDSCEGEQSYDEPFMYEAGWGKSLTYIFSISPYSVIDSTRRYTQKFTSDVLARRTVVSEPWLATQLADLNRRLVSELGPDMRTHIVQKTESEIKGLSGVGEGGRAVHGDEIKGRVSGDEAWKAARGEDGGASGSADRSANPDPDIIKAHHRLYRVGITPAASGAAS